MTNDNQDITLKDVSKQIELVAQAVATLSGEVSDLKQEVGTIKQTMATKFASVKLDIAALKQDVGTTQRQLSEFRKDVEERLLTSEEKNDLFAIIRDYNAFLHASATGGDRITLTRPEYDAIQTTVTFPHRFLEPHADD
jgi:regulator of replication initiation timing